MNGVTIGMIVTITAVAPKTIPLDPQTALPVFCGVVLGATAITIVVLPIAITMFRILASTTTGFDSSGLSKMLPFALFPFFVSFFGKKEKVLIFCRK